VSQREGREEMDDKKEENDWSSERLLPLYIFYMAATGGVSCDRAPAPIDKGEKINWIGKFPSPRFIR
jgi:hypothetical protein